ncbi:MAG: DUF2793 domain-containing protein [Pseudomonadota bacterium]
MADTLTLGLPLLEAAQAQKHVTVNEALARLDAVTGGLVASIGAVSPPAVVDGEAHVVGLGATGDWAGQDGALAYAVNGGWAFVAPATGMAVTDTTGARHAYLGGSWVEGAVAGGAGGAATLARVVAVDHDVAAGATSTAVAAIPAGSVVIGVSARVEQALGGASSWQLGVAGSADRYGSGLGVAANSYAAGITGQPQAYYAATDLVLTASGGDFTAGRLRLAVHLLAIVPPPAF